MIYVGGDSDITEDRSGTGGTANPLTAAPTERWTPSWERVQLPVAQAGTTYFVAVHSTGNTPAILNAAFTPDPGAASELVRAGADRLRAASR